MTATAVDDVAVVDVLNEAADTLDTTLRRELRNAAAMLDPAQARYLVDYYYQMQRDRIRHAHRIRTLEVARHPVLDWLEGSAERYEGTIRGFLDIYTDQHVVGRWMKSITGIGPVIASGLMAHIDITKAPTVGHIWSFAGLNPDVRWDKGKKRPWNATLKTLCWKVGDSFWKQHNRESDVYGHLIAGRKEMEIERNERGDFAEQAKASLAAKKYGDDTKAKAAYDMGKLPDARIHLRAQRWGVKLFLSALHHVMYEDHYGKPPPKPYILDRDPKHAHYMGPPNWPMA